MCDNWVLASIYSWIQGGRPKDDVVEKVMTSFDAKVLRAAAGELRNGGWTTPQVQVPQEGTPDYSRRLAETVYNGLLSIQNAAPLKLHFWVSAVELYRVPGVGAFPDNLGQPAVSARLADVDLKLQLVLDKLVATEHLEQTVAGLAGTVTSLQDQLREQKQEQLRMRQLTEEQQEEAAARGDWPRQGGSMEAAQPTVQLKVMTYADRVKAQEQARRERSGSTKRGRGRSDSGGARVPKQPRLVGQERVSRWDQQ